MRPAAFGSQKLSTVLLTMRAAQSSLFAAESFRCGCDRQVRVAGATRDHPAALLARLSAPTHLPCTHVAISISIVFVSFRLCAAPMAAATPATSSTALSTCAALLLDTLLKLFSAATPLWKSGRWPLAAAAPPPVARHKCSLQAVANIAVTWHWLDCKSSIFKFPH